jgi:hypothetical protein
MRGVHSPVMIVEETATLSSARFELGRVCSGRSGQSVGQRLALLGVTDPFDGIVFLGDGIIIDLITQLAGEVKEGETTFAFIMAECTRG